MAASKLKIAVISGAGISAESGISTFRDNNGLWENHSIEDVATPEGWKKNPQLVLDFYNERRRKLKTAHPNKAHLKLAAWEEYFDISIITQNVDDLHERAGSAKVIHLHGELLKARSSNSPDFIIPQTEDIQLGQCCPQGFQLRPHIVWFGEMVPMIEAAASEVAAADLVVVIGTSLQVYPAAGLVGFARSVYTPVYLIDPFPLSNFELNRFKNLTVIKDSAVTGIEILEKYLFDEEAVTDKSPNV